MSATSQEFADDDRPTVRKGAEWIAGDFQEGDRVRVTDTKLHHNGALGSVVRIDQGSIFPVVVWLDVFGKPNRLEIEGRTGLPLCASEIERVGE